MAVQRQPISGSQLFDFWTALCKDETPLSLWTVKLCHGWPNTGGGKEKEPLGRQMLSSPLKEKKNPASESSSALLQQRRRRNYSVPVANYITAVTYSNDAHLQFEICS